MLHHILLDQKLAVLNALVIAGVKVRDFRGVEQLDAASAGAVERLDHKEGIALAEGLKLLKAGLPQIQPQPAVQAVETAQELGFVAEQVPVLRGVEAPDIFVVFAARHIGGALGGGERLKLKKPVVGIAGAVFDGAAQHVAQDDKFRASAPLGDHRHRRLEARQIHIGRPADEILQLSQGRTSSDKRAAFSVRSTFCISCRCRRGRGRWDRFFCPDAAQCGSACRRPARARVPFRWPLWCA